MSRFRPLGKAFVVSVLVCTRNRFSDALECLHSISNQSRLPDEVIVVDSSDTHALKDALKGRLAEKIASVAYVHSAPGLTLQRNIAVRQASGDVLIFLDDDVVLEREYIAAHVDVYAEDTEGCVAGVQGSFVNVISFGPWKRLIYRLFMLPGQSGLGRMQPSGFPSFVAVPGKTLQVDTICGGNTSYRKEVFAEFHFDENLKGYAYMEDDDFSYRVSRRYRLMQTPRAKLVHKHSPASRVDVEAQQKMEVWNHWYFFSRNMPKSALTWAAFAWSEIGLCILVARNHGARVLVRRLRTYPELTGRSIAGRGAL